MKILPPTDEFQTTYNLSKSIFKRENKSQQYQRQLESSIREEQAANRQILDHCAWLESIVKGSEHARLQHEATLGHLTENLRILHRDLMLSRQKADELYSCIEHQKLVSEALLRSVAPGDGDQLRALNIHHILLENQWQRGQISILQNTVQMREKTVRDLQMALEEAHEYDSLGCPGCDIDCYQSNMDRGTPSPKFFNEDDEETLCEPDTVSGPSIGSPRN